jgi:hypothetical protein
MKNDQNALTKNKHELCTYALFANHENISLLFMLDSSS